jgi:uncharacterized Fe-S cluster-containing radical SAM superfamily protein
MLNPLEVTRQVERIVSRKMDRKYYRFRTSKFYGGIATAECVGCNLVCSVCPGKNYNRKPEEHGKFYSPKEVVDRLVKIAKKNDFNHCQISGGEPTISWSHLLRVLKLLSKTGLGVILETNGILIGYNDSYANQLSDYKNVQIKVSFKGATPEEFSKVTGAGPNFFELQIFALKNLSSAGVPCNAAVMKTFSRPESIERLRDRLETINPSLYDIEEEAVDICVPKTSSRARNSV